MALTLMCSLSDNIKPAIVLTLCLWGISCTQGFPEQMSVGADSEPVVSELWGRDGEQWEAGGRLPDFSYAGYRHGEQPIPDVPVAANVQDFGARGDDEHDDTEAFQNALASVERGAVFIPPGRYTITGILEITRPGIVLRGAGSTETTLVFPKPLNDIKPNWGATTTGQRTSNYAWSGGFVHFKGNYRSTVLASLEPAQRGDTRVTVADTAGLRVGQWIELFVQDDATQSLAVHLYDGDPGSIDKLDGRARARLVARIEHLEGHHLDLNRPLRFDLRPEWQPVVRRFDPTVQECGVEGLKFEFPNQPYEGHFSELGFNAVAFYQVANCWVRDLHLHNADSGLFPGGTFTTIQGVRFTSEREPWRHPEGPDRHPDNTVGHHGIYIGGDDNLFTDFSFESRFVHDISLSHGAGNVISNGSGVDLALDHHKRHPYANLITNVDLGAGTRPWHSGGGADLGKNCGAWGTFWNLRADQSLAFPLERFAPRKVNFIGVQFESVQDEYGRWVEAAGATVVPANLHEAQLERRLRSASR